jgi:5-methyltetrahydrofolate--homocysteine methyltransferase
MSATKALAAIRDITVHLGCKTSLGVSNVSFGLPERVRLNSAFLTMAAAAGLTAAIINPASEDMMRAVRASEALLGYNGALLRYVDSAAKNAASAAPVSQNTAKITLKEAIVRGLADSAVSLVREALTSRAPLDIVNADIVPALGAVGEAYEAGRIFLPGLLLAADAASSAFSVIREASADTSVADRGSILLATVKGDVHDIGKNIVKLLLENYGFAVTDLGRDVSVDVMLDELSRGSYGILALSALMTTTAREMEYAIERIKPLYPDLKIIVGGAVVTEAYAEKIGADGYAPDAMAAVRLCERLLNS